MHQGLARPLAWYFLRLGAVGFGGPVALVARMREDLVEHRKWVSDEGFRDGVALAQVAPGGWLAFQVPGNFDEPSHTIRAELAAEPPYVEHSPDAGIHGSEEPAAYLEALAAAGCAVDVWETTYLHVLEGEDPVFTWVSGTGARPTLQALPDGLRDEFEAEFKRRLREAYPVRDGRVVLPFRRIFVVARQSDRVSA